MTTVPPSVPRLGPRSIQSFASSSADKPSSSRHLPAKPITLAKRILFPTLPAHADLPPLLASPAAALELNAELYDFIALALRAYVNTWWSKITRYDKEFLPQITRILTTVLRALETRLLDTDLSPLVFRDLPTLLTQHWTDYRNAQAKLHTSYATGGASTLPQLFHQMQPHMAVSADGIIDPVYVRQAVDHILKTCLPPEDYEPETERFIVREIILKVITGVLPRITQPWFIHKIILDQLGPEKVAEGMQEALDLDHSGPASTDRPGLHRRSSQQLSFQSLAVFVLSAVQSISGVCLALLHAYKQARDTIKKVNQSKRVHSSDGQANGLREQQDEEHIAKHQATITPVPALPGTLRIPSRFPAPPHLPPSPSSESASYISPPSQTSSTSQLPGPGISLPAATAAPPPPPPIPNYTHPPLVFVLTLLTPPPAAPSATPAHASLTTAHALTHLLTLLASLAAPFLVRLLPYLLYTLALSPAMLANVVRNARRALFPEGWPGPPPVDPTPEEQVELRAAVRTRLAECVSRAVAPLLGPTSAARAATIDAALAPLDDPACNAHLAVFILDLVLLTVFPELGVSEDS